MIALLYILSMFAVAMTKMEQTTKSAVVGAFVADAATVGVHWIYDTEKLAKLLKDAGKFDNPEFLSPPAGPFYTYADGSSSPWATEALQVLEYFSKDGQAAFDGPKFMKHTYDYFQAYQASGGRLNQCMKDILAGMDEGKEWPNLAANNGQCHGISKSPILVARYRDIQDRKEFAKQVEAVISSHQNNPLGVDFGIAAALILRDIVKGAGIQEALDKAEDDDELFSEQVRKALKTVKEKQNSSQPLPEIIAEMGPGCNNPGCFMGSVYILRKYTDFTEAIRANALAGGDNCGRSIFIGACLGAAGGNSPSGDSIPQEWKDKTNELPRVIQYLDVIHDATCERF